jgi:hypothetical protein
MEQDKANQLSFCALLGGQVFRPRMPRVATCRQDRTGCLAGAMEKIPLKCYASSAATNSFRPDHVRSTDSLARLLAALCRNSGPQPVRRRPETKRIRETTIYQGLDSRIGHFHACARLAARPTPRRAGMRRVAGRRKTTGRVGRLTNPYEPERFRFINDLGFPM